MITTKPDLCIYHGNKDTGGGCLDGFAAAWAVHQKWGDEVEYLAANYGDAPPDVAGKVVLIVDFSYPEEVLIAMAAAASEVIVFDHHKSAREHLLRLGSHVAATETDPGRHRIITTVFDLNRSGAGITYSEVWGTTRSPHLVEACQDRDLWRFAIPYTRELTALLASYPYDFKVWTNLAREMENPAPRAILAREGAAIMRARDKDIRQLLEATTRRMSIAGHDVPSANVPHFWASEAGNILAEGEPFAATWFANEAGERCFSLRSSGQDAVDVSEIAQMFGGGGHKNAAGFRIAHPLPNTLLALHGEQIEGETIELAPQAPPMQVQADTEFLSSISLHGADPAKWRVTTSKDRVLPILRLLDGDGEETEGKDGAVFYVIEPEPGREVTLPIMLDPEEPLQ